MSEYGKCVSHHICECHREKLERFEAENEKFKEALRDVDVQTPDAIGGESYTISPGALYGVRIALYGSGVPRSSLEVDRKEST